MTTEDTTSGSVMSRAQNDRTGQRDNGRPVEPGQIPTIAPTLGRAYRSGAGTVDQLLVELVDQFQLDAMAIDPTITGLWLLRDLTAPDRDPKGAVQGILLEREHAPLCRKAGA